MKVRPSVKRICKKCKVNNVHKELILKKHYFKIENEETKFIDIDPKMKIKKLVENVYDTHYDDIIDKKLPVKFKVYILFIVN
jgi:hypothetical protein